MNQTMSQRLADFEDGATDRVRFGHRQHVEMACAMLDHYPFLEALERYSTAIREFANKAGAPGKFHVTVTLGFLSLIAERMAKDEGSPGVEAFLGTNSDLLRSDVLAQWYSGEVLGSDVARTSFVLPDRAPPGAA